jgi:hypothetical protein
MQRKVTTTYLELSDPVEVRPRRDNDARVQLVRAEIPSPELSRFLYATVGAQWWWQDRLGWDYARWLAYVDRPELWPGAER